MLSGSRRHIFLLEQLDSPKRFITCPQLINPHRRLFRKTAANMGLTVRVKSGGSWKTRSKTDILNDYMKKVGELQLSSGSAPDPLSPSASAETCAPSASAPGLDFSQPSSSSSAFSASQPSASSGLFSHGFLLQAGPALVPEEECPLAGAATSKRGGTLKGLVRKLQEQGGPRMRPPREKKQNKLRMQSVKNKEAHRRREATEDARRKNRERKKTDEQRIRDREAKVCARAARKKRGCARVEKIYSNRMAETVYEGGTWQQASQIMAKKEGRASEELPLIMPPSFAGLHETMSLQHIAQMYGFFKETKWCTCVGCWRAWYRTPHHYSFDQVLTKTGAYKPWFQPERSTFL